MIIQDKTSYGNYVKKTKKDIQTLLDMLSAVSVIQPELKQQIEDIHTKISAKISLLEIKSQQTNSIISLNDWGKHKNEIDSLYKELKNKVDQAINYSRLCSGARQM